MEVRKYTPESGLKNPKKLLSGLAIDIINAGPLALRFAKRNISARYRQSFLGIFWALIPPLATSLIWIILNSQQIVRFDTEHIPYPVFVIVGTMAWQIFTGSITAVINSVYSNQSLLVKLNFPRESLIFTGMLETIFTMLIKVIFLIILLLFFGIQFNLSIVAGLLGIIIMMVLGTSIGLVIVPIAMLYKDIQMGIGFFLQFIMYLTPVVYPPKTFSGVLSFLNYNPFTYLIEFTRNSICGQPYDSYVGLIGIIIAIITFFLGLLIFRLAMPILIERLGS